MRDRCGGCGHSRLEHKDGTGACSGLMVRAGTANRRATCSCIEYVAA